MMTNGQWERVEGEGKVGGCYQCRSSPPTLLDSALKLFDRLARQHIKAQNQRGDNWRWPVVCLWWSWVVVLAKVAAGGSMVAGWENQFVHSLWQLQRVMVEGAGWIMLGQADPIIIDPMQQGHWTLQWEIQELQFLFGLEIQLGYRPFSPPSTHQPAILVH